MLQEYAIDEIPLQIRRVGFFQQDGAPTHYVRTVRAYFDQTFPGRWIGCGEWSRSVCTTGKLSTSMT
jgi:hypothetical protein